MSEICPELIQDAISLDILDKDLYRSRKLWKPVNGRGVFGGQTISQATWAATLSVKAYHEAETPDQPLKGLHSLHAYFLSFGNAERPILYSVQRLRNGRSYATFSVLATQAGTPIFSLTCSFCLPEPKQPTRAVEMPSYILDGKAITMPMPETLKATEDVIKVALEEGVPAKLKDYIERYYAERRQSAIEIRDCDPKQIGIISAQRHMNPQPIQAYWFRTRAPVKHDPAFQKCVLAFASDLQFVGTASRSVGLGSRTTPKLGMLASLDHAMYFYEDIQPDEFNLFYMDSPIVSNGRGLVQGRIYRRDGTLGIVCTQEGVVRAAL